MKKVTKKVAKAEVKKPVKKAVGKSTQKAEEGVSAKTKALLSSVCKKFAKANGLTMTNATMMVGGCLAHFAIDRAIDNEIKAGRKVKARRADKKALDDIVKKLSDIEAVKALKVKAKDISGMDKLMQEFAKEIDTIDFGET